MTRRPATPVADFELDRLLADGQPGGPERDHLWRQLQADLPRIAGAAPSPRSSWWAGAQRKPWRAVGVGVLPLAAATAAVLIWIGDGRDDASGFQARGDARHSPVLEATCGTAEHPCRVGEPVYLRLHSGEHGGLVTISIDDAVGERPLFGPHRVAAGQAVDVPVALQPELRDIGDGVDVVQCFVPKAPDRKPVETHPPPGEEDACQRVRLHLEVVSP